MSIYLINVVLYLFICPIEVFTLHVLEALPYKDVCVKTGQKNWAARKAFTRAIIKWEKYISNEQKETKQVPINEMNNNKIEFLFDIQNLNFNIEAI